MKYPTKEDIISPSAYKHLPAVRLQMEDLAEKRDRLGAPFLKKKYRYLDGTIVLLHAMIGFNKIIMWGGGEPLILLTNYTSAQGYDYYSDVLSSATIAPLSITTKPVSPLYNGRNQIGDYTQMTRASSWSSEIIGNNYDFLGGINEYEMGVFLDLQDIYARVGDSIGHIATFTDTFLQGYAKPYGDLFCLPTYKEVPTWNLYNGLTINALDPSSLDVATSGFWVPSFFTVFPRDENFLKPGVYYGAYPWSDYGIEDPLESAKVSLRAILDTRYKEQAGSYLYGWAEIVTEINGEAKNDLHFYFQQSPLAYPANDTITNIATAGTAIDQLITTGSELGGWEPNVTLNPDNLDATVSMWNFQKLFVETPDGSQDSGVCIVLVDGSTTTFYRYTGALATVYTTETYHSHSTSRDGTILAIFESDDGNLITNVQVFDLYGTREPTRDSEYTSGDFTQLRTDGSVVSAEALTGCVIPYREEDFEPSSPIVDLATKTPKQMPTTYVELLPQFGITSFLRSRLFSPTFKKITCENGVDAEYNIFVDSCFDSTFVIDDPELGVNPERLIGQWDGGGILLRGVLRGSFNKISETGMTFIGEGDDGKEIDTITGFEPDDMYMQRDVFKCVSFEDYNGDVIIGSNLYHDGSCWKVDETSNPCAPWEGVTATASSTCGGSAELVIPPAEVDPVPDLEISVLDEVDCGDFIGATGGSAPYSFTFTGGTVDADTGEILSITACGAPADPRTATAGVTDQCGNSDSAEVRLPGGYWANVYDSGLIIPFFQPEDCWTYGGGEDPCNEIVSKIVGGTRYRDSWGRLIYDGHGKPECSASTWSCVNTPDTEPFTCPELRMCVSRKWRDLWLCSAGGGGCP